MNDKPKRYDDMTLDEKITAVERAIKLQNELSFVDECVSYRDYSYDPDGDDRWKNYEKSSRLNERLRILKAERAKLDQAD